MGCALCRGWLEMKLCRSWDLSCSTGNLKGEWMAHGGMACMDTPCNSAQTSAQTSPAPGKEALQPHSNDTLSAALQTQHCEMWTREVAQELPWALAAARSNSTLGCTNRSIGTASREMMTLLSSALIRQYLKPIWGPISTSKTLTSQGVQQRAPKTVGGSSICPLRRGWENGLWCA